MIRRCYSR